MSQRLFGFALAVAIAWLPSLAASQPELMKLRAGDGSEIIIKPSNLADAVVTQEPGSGDFLVLFRLEEKGAVEMEAFTAARIGSKVALDICGETVAEPLVREAIRGGLLQVRTSSREKAESIAGNLKDGRCE